MTDLLAFEDFQPGQKYALGERTLTEAEIIAFASEYDPQPQHTDPEAAKHGMLGGLIASGWHLCAVAMRMIVDGLFGRAMSLGSPGVEEVQWRRPVRPGEMLRLESEVLETSAPASKPDRGFVRIRFEMFRGDEKVMLFIATAMIAKRING